MRNRILPVAFAIALFPLVPAVAGKPITFSSDRMSGAAGKKTESTSLIGNAKVTVGTLTITGERIDLTGTDYRYVKATGSITGVDSEKGYSFTADELSYDRDTEVATFRGNAKLLDTAHEVEASAGIITYNQQTEVALLQLVVKLKKNKIDCTSGFALYRRTVSMLELTGSPYVLRDGDEFKADRISVNLDTERITLDGTVRGTLKKDDGKKEKGSAGDEKNDNENNDGTSTDETKATGLKKADDSQKKDMNQ